MKKCLFKLIVASIVCFCAITSNAQSRSLFNGKDLGGWHVDVPEMDTNSSARNPFIVRSGLL